MKKSRSIRLVLLGGAGLAFTGCGDSDVPPDAKFFSSLSECTAFYDAATCSKAKISAEQTYAAEAPRFGKKEECEAEFGVGSCENQQVAAAPGQTAVPGQTPVQPMEASSGGSFFMPMMMGYMLGNMMGGNSFQQPVYRGRDGAAVMPAGGKAYNVGNFAGSGSPADAKSFRPAAQVTQVARGGFGSSATAMRSTSSGTSAGG